MSSCIKCGKYSIGNTYCYDCYQDMLQNSIVKISDTPNTCIKCNKKINTWIYCEECYRKHVALTVDDILLKLYNDFDPKKDDDIWRKRMYMGISQNQCVCCNDKAIIGSKYCQKHHPSFIDFTPKKSNEAERKIHQYYEYCLHCGRPSYGNQYCFKCYFIHPKITEAAKITPQIKAHKGNLCQFCGKASGIFDICKDCYTYIKKNNRFYYYIEEYEISDHKKSPKDKYDNKQYICESGFIVKSQGERTISDFLFKNNIPHEYERKLHYREKNIITEKSIEKTIKPDFYIEGPITFNGRILKDIYMEFFGLKGNIDYDKSNEYKKRIYEALQTTVIIIYPEDMEDYKKSLTYKLSTFTNNKINFFKES